MSVLNNASLTTIGDPGEGDYAVTVKPQQDEKERLLTAFTQIGVHYTTVPWRPGCVFIHDLLSLDRLCWFSYQLDAEVALELERLVEAIEQQLEQLKLEEVAA